MSKSLQEILNEVNADIDYYKRYKFGLYAFIMEHYASTKHSDKLPPEIIITLFKEITSVDYHINKLYRIIRSHDP